MKFIIWALTMISGVKLAYAQDATSMQQWKERYGSQGTCSDFVAAMQDVGKPSTAEKQMRLVMSGANAGMYTIIRAGGLKENDTNFFADETTMVKNWNEVGSLCRAYPDFKLGQFMVFNKNTVNQKNAELDKLFTNIKVQQDPNITAAASYLAKVNSARLKFSQSQPVN